MNLLQRIIQPAAPVQERQLVELMSTMTGEKVERIGENFQGFVSRAYQDNGVVWAAVVARLVLFSQARFVLRNRRTKEIEDLPSRLQFLEEPFPGGTTAELLARVEQDTSLAGNYYVYAAEPDHWQRLRPDWIDIVTNGRQPIGYAYYEGGQRDKRPRILEVEKVAHGAPYPDPLKAFVGNSWLTAVVRDIMSDQAMNSHKLKYFENAATPNLLIKLQQTLNTEQKQSLQAALEQRHTGLQNAWKTMVLEGGADAQIIGSQFEEIAFDVIQAAGVERIAQASRVPLALLGTRQGNTTYSNYPEAVRSFADHTMQHLWAHAAGVFSQIVPGIPASKELWFDTRHISALQADKKDEAAIRQIDASTISSLTDSGFEPNVVIDAVTTGDLRVLKGHHTGLFSVQLQKPGTTSEPDVSSPNGAVVVPSDDDSDPDERFDSVIAALTP